MQSVEFEKKLEKPLTIYREAKFLSHYVDSLQSKWALTKSINVTITFYK